MLKADMVRKGLDLFVPPSNRGHGMYLLFLPLSSTCLTRWLSQACLDCQGPGADTNHSSAARQPEASPASEVTLQRISSGYRAFQDSYTQD